MELWGLGTSRLLEKSHTRGRKGKVKFDTYNTMSELISDYLNRAKVAEGAD